MKTLAATLLFVLSLGTMRPAWAGEELVLITSARSDIIELGSPVVRKIFLGLSATQQGLRLHAAINESDPKIRELFLQNIVSMSDSNYDRFLLHSLLQGRRQPHVYADSKSLIDAIAGDTALVSYAWMRDVAQDPRIRVLRVLWHD